MSKQLVKQKIHLDQIMKDAKTNSILPMAILLGNPQEKTEKMIHLNSSNSEKEWIVPFPMDSFIMYTHEHTCPAKIPKLRIDNFFERGFPKYSGKIDSKYLQKLATIQQERNKDIFDIIIKKLLLFSEDGTKKEEIIFKGDLGEMSIPNKKLCKVIYKINCSKSDSEIRLDHLLERKTFPKDPRKTLKLQDLETCLGFDEIILKSFQSDVGTAKVTPLDRDNFVEYEYLN